jgi:hypothetical protein
MRAFDRRLQSLERRPELLDDADNSIAVLFPTSNGEPQPLLYESNIRVAVVVPNVVDTAEVIELSQL